jgi:hypothetical protein
MPPEPYVNRILDDEGLVGDLESEAAQRLVAWLVRSAEHLAGQAPSDAIARAAIEALCQRGREIAKSAAAAPDPIAVLDALLAKESLPAN